MGSMENPGSADDDDMPPCDDDEDGSSKEAFPRPKMRMLQKQNSRFKLITREEAEEDDHDSTSRDKGYNRVEGASLAPNPSSSVRKKLLQKEGSRFKLIHKDICDDDSSSSCDDGRYNRVERPSPATSRASSPPKQRPLRQQDSRFKLLKQEGGAVVAAKQGLASSSENVNDGSNGVEAGIVSPSFYQSAPKPKDQTPASPSRIEEKSEPEPSLSMRPRPRPSRMLSLDDFAIARQRRSGEEKISSHGSKSFTLGARKDSYPDSFWEITTPSAAALARRRSTMSADSITEANGDAAVDNSIRSRLSNLLIKDSSPEALQTEEVGTAVHFGGSDNFPALDDSHEALRVDENSASEAKEDDRAVNDGYRECEEEKVIRSSEIEEPAVSAEESKVEETSETAVRAPVVKEAAPSSKNGFRPKHNLRKSIKKTLSQTLSALDITAEKVASAAAEITHRNSTNSRNSATARAHNSHRDSRKDALARERALKRREQQHQQQQQQRQLQLQRRHTRGHSQGIGGLNNDSSSIMSMSTESSMDAATKSSGDSWSIRESWSERQEREVSDFEQRRHAARYEQGYPQDGGEGARGSRQHQRSFSSHHRPHRSSVRSRSSRVSESPSHPTFQSSSYSRRHNSSLSRSMSGQSDGRPILRQPQHHESVSSYHVHNRSYNSSGSRDSNTVSMLSWGDLEEAIENGSRSSIEYHTQQQTQQRMNQLNPHHDYDYHQRSSAPGQYTRDDCPRRQQNINHSRGGREGGGQGKEPISWDDLDDAIQHGLESSLQDLTFRVIEKQQQAAVAPGGLGGEGEGRRASENDAKWQCGHCTFVNVNGTFLLCGVCNRPRHDPMTTTC